MEFYPSLKHARVRLTGDWKEGAAGEFWRQNKDTNPERVVQQYGKAILCHLVKQREGAWTSFRVLRKGVAEQVVEGNALLQALRFSEDTFRTALDHLISLGAGIEYSMDERNGETFRVNIPKKRRIRAIGRDLDIDHVTDRIGHLDGKEVTILAVVRDEHSRDERFFIEEHFYKEGFDSRFFTRV